MSGMGNGIGDCVPCMEAAVTGDASQAVTSGDRMIVLHARVLIQGTGYCTAHARRLMQDGVIRKLMREQRS